MLKTANLRTTGAGLFAILLCLALSAAVQAAPRTVKVEEPEDGAHHYMLPPINLDVIKAFADRVTTNDRFTLTKEPAELIVFIICLDTRKDDTSAEGGFCTYRFEYRSKKAPEFN